MRSFAAALLTVAMTSGAAIGAEGIHWGYEGEAGAGHWGELDPGFALCGIGGHQSPIDLRDADAVPASLTPLHFAYGAVTPSLVNNGHTVQADIPGAQALTAEGQDYALLQFHFHAPGEYALEGQIFPLELHLVHRRDDGALGVVGVFFEAGESHPVLDILWQNLPAGAGEQASADTAIDLNTLLPDDRRYFRFMGSLTTPPCSEGVNWFVLEQPLTASAEQIAQFAALFPHGNARPLQPAGHRLIVRDSQ